MVRVMGWVEKIGRVIGQSFFALSQKSRFGLGIFQAGLGQQILTCFAMSRPCQWKVIQNYCEWN